MLDPSLITNFEQTYGSVPKVVSRLIRPAMIAAPKRTLVWGDWSSIEARVLPYLAGAAGERMLNVFRSNDMDPNMPDVYKMEAAGILDKDPYDINAEERQTGKVSILALGFGGGEGALEAMATNYGIHMEPEQRAFTVRRWRSNNQWAVKFWSELNDAFFRAWANPGEVCAAGRVAYVFMPDYLRGTMLCYLPDGRPLAYAALRREKIKEMHESTGDEVVSWKVRYQHGYGRGTIWHGILAENITQAFAASLLRNLLVRLRRIPFSFMPVVGHTHDEVITEPMLHDEERARKWLQNEMQFVPEYAKGLPLVADVTSNWFYTKHKEK